MTRPLPDWNGFRPESPAETIARLEQECAQLRWERDHLAAQGAEVERLWQELTATAAECDNLRAELMRFQTEQSDDMAVVPKVGTDQLAWIVMSVSGRVPDSQMCNSESR